LTFLYLSSHRQTAGRYLDDTSCRAYRKSNRVTSLPRKGLVTVRNSDHTECSISWHCIGGSKRSAALYRTGEKLRLRYSTVGLSRISLTHRAPFLSASLTDVGLSVRQDECELMAASLRAFVTAGAKLPGALQLYLSSAVVILRKPYYRPFHCASMLSEKGDVAEYRPLNANIEDDGDVILTASIEAHRCKSHWSRTTIFYFSLLLNILLAVAATVVLVRFPREQTCVNFFNEACTCLLAWGVSRTDAV
jgi:hypothetical protein